MTDIYQESRKIKAVMDNNLTDDEIEEFEERAAIIQFDGGRSRDQAENVAMAAILANRRNKR